MFDKSPFIFKDEQEYKDRKKKSYLERNGSVIKIAFFLILGYFVLIEAGSIIDSYVFKKRGEEIAVKREAFLEELSLKSNDEKFVMMIEDLDKDDHLVEDIIISDEDNAIYICVEGGLTATDEVWAIRKDFQNKMAIIAANSEIEKEIFLVGVKQGVFIWAIGDDGEILSPSELQMMNGGEEIDV